MTEKKERAALNRGDELELVFRAMGGQIYTQKAVIEDQIGRGASCLTYIVRLFSDEKHSSRMIMKEFYPLPEGTGFQIERRGTKLCASGDGKGRERYRKLKEGFRQSFQLQNALSDSGAMEVMVRPYHLAEYGDSLYILSDMHLGTILARSEVKSLSEKLWLIYRTAEAVDLLNEQGYLYMDLNPSNILWIPSQQSVKLFDVDSMIPWHNLEKIHHVRVTHPYTPPELEELEEWFDINKEAFLKPTWDVYCLGLIFFQLLTGRFPTEEDLKTGYGNEYEMEQICMQAGCEEPGTAAFMKKILARSLSRKFRVRYSSAGEMCSDLNRLKKMLDAQEFIPKKEYARANDMMQSYHILEKWPVYQYKRREEGRGILDIAVCGKQPVREAFFKAAFSCVHMPGMMLRIRLYADDAAGFAEKMKKENPAFVRTVHIFQEDECIWGEEDRRNAGPLVCEEPIAEIRLYEKSQKEMLANGGALIKEIPSPYVLLLWNDRSSGELLLNGVSETVLSEERKCSYYNEELFGTKIMKWALNVHDFYYRGTHERASKEEVRRTFENDIYNLDSSMRSALSVKYKLGAAGVDPDGPDPAGEFYRKVLSPETGDKEMFDILSAQEHLSWCAFMVVSGWDLPEESEIGQYAFAGGNDFKDRERRLHPCLVPSRPGNRLKTMERRIWNRQKLSRSVTAQLDDLEQMCLKLHRIAGNRAKEIRPEVNRLCGQLARKLARYHNGEADEAFRWLMTVKERVYAGESNAELVWNQAAEQLGACCEKVCGYDRSVREYLDEICGKLAVVHEYNAYHDYKDSDEDIVRGIPRLLSAGTVQTVIRPYLQGRENGWKNILSVLFLEPENLVFVPVEDGEIDTEFYENFLRYRGCDTGISVRGLSDAAGYSSPVIDVTGFDARELYRIRKYSESYHIPCVMVKDSRLLGLDNPAVEMYARQIHLTVEETFYLFRAYMDSDKKENAILGLSSRYRGLWGAYTELGAWKWKNLIEQLVRIERENICVLNTGEPGRRKSYRTAPVSGNALLCTGLDLVFEQCRENGLIASYWLPGPEDELPAEFTAGSEETAEILESLVLQADREPMKHQYAFARREKIKHPAEGGYTEYLVKDRTLYVSAVQKRKDLKDSSGEQADLAEIVREGLRRLEEYGLKGSGGRQNLIQNLKVSEKDGEIAFTFKYASDAVKACLSREGNILEAMIYFTCLEMGIFDDLNINSEFSWNSEDGTAADEYPVNNEIDIIGTKDLRTYFISAKMTVPETAHLMEIKYFADHFGIDGQAVLVTSNSRTADDSAARPVSKEERSRMMGVRYINRTVIDEGRLGDVIREIVEEKRASV